MTPPIFVGDPRQHTNVPPPPERIIRDIGERIFAPTRKRHRRLPIWPGFRLELRILPARGAEHV